MPVNVILRVNSNTSHRQQLVFDEEEDTPWCSILVRFLFLTVVYDFGFGDDNKEIYNNQ